VDRNHLCSQNGPGVTRTRSGVPWDAKGIIKKLLLEIVDFADEKGHFQDEYNLVKHGPTARVEFLPDE
jgi:hypothetical protein